MPDDTNTEPITPTPLTQDERIDMFNAAFEDLFQVLAAERLRQAEVMTKLMKEEHVKVYIKCRARKLRGQDDT